MLICLDFDPVSGETFYLVLLLLDVGCCLMLQNRVLVNCGNPNGFITTVGHTC